jgi:voltage-gated potassium channel
MTTRDGEALIRFEGLTAWPMLVLSLAIIPLLVIPLTVDLSPGMIASFDALDWMIWAAFAAEYGIRLYLAPDRPAFVRRNLIDLVVVVLPFLRPLRVVRSARALRLLRAARVATFLLRGVAAGRDVMRRHGLQYVLLVAAGVIVAGGLLVEEAERNAPGASIHGFANGLWWAVTTVTTVGYGDMTPVTPAGRGIAVVLMIVGIGLFGALAASLASFFIEQRQEDTVQPQLDDMTARLQRIEDTLVALSATPAERSASSTRDPSSPSEGDQS